MSAHHARNGRRPAGAGNNNHNSNRGINRLQFPEKQTAAPQREPREVPGATGTIFLTESQAVGLVLVVRHPGGDLTIADTALPTRLGFQEARLRFFDNSLRAGDTYEAIMISRSGCGVWFTNQQLTRNDAGKWVVVTPRCRDIHSSFRFGSTRDSLDSQLEVRMEECPTGGQVFGKIRACPEAELLKELTEWTRMGFRIGGSPRFTDYQSVALVDHQDSELDAIRAELPAETTDDILEGLEALEAFETVGAGYALAGGEVVIVDQARVARANALSEEIKVKVRALQLAPAETVELLAPRIPALVAMAEAVVDYEELSGEEVTAAMPTYEETMQATSSPSFAEARAAKRKQQHLGTYAEVMASAPKAELPASTEVHFQEEAETVPAA